MHAQVIFVNDGSQRHALERLNEQVIKGLIFILVKNFISECEVLRHGPTLMVTSQHDDFFRIV